MVADDAVVHAGDPLFLIDARRFELAARQAEANRATLGRRRRRRPLVCVGAMWLNYFVGFRMIPQSGAPAGMLIITVAVRLSVIGMNGNATVETLRDGFVQASRWDDDAVPDAISGF